MTDITMARLHEGMVVLYAISLVLYFLDFFYQNKRAEKYGFYLVSIVWVLQSIFLVLYMMETNRFPILTLFEGIYFYAWLLITLSLVLHLTYKVKILVFSLNIIGFVMMMIHTFAPVQLERSPVGENLVSELLFIHVTFAIISYVAFSLSFVFSVLYQLLYRLLKKKKWTIQWRNLPSLDQTEKGMTISMIIGIPSLLLSLILGMQWAYLSLDSFSLFDMKIVGSFILLIFYSVILYRHHKNALLGTQYAWAHIYAFLVVLLNFFLGSRLSEFHFWL
ncbi:cytochrome c biogenesis protein CcsA [Paenisporosarcina cavernae]|uniref:Cytochrome C assembly protein n=1 Tax=Paenisporosarcina cavernae TaxID=2320858 RepID=A0A385YW60_9BACL|nr:cytochrome c biogenesis protein CcsA [Paenisporosarcina cavernae]AYC29773.1 cytochrome C assembly protein [Paenisporosarcina cavernae]